MSPDATSKGRVPRIAEALGAAMLLMSVVSVMSGPAAAQPAGAMPPNPTPQERYQRQIAFCNSGQLPAPQRDACVRNAGELLDKRLGGTPEPVQQTSPDGQSTVVSPPNQPVPSGDPVFVPSPDGRAEIGVPPPGAPPR